MTFEEFDSKFQWDNTIKISGKCYNSYKMSVTENGQETKILRTAEDLIKLEIHNALQAIERQKATYENELNEIQQFEALFNKYKNRKDGLSIANFCCDEEEFYNIENKFISYFYHINNKFQEFKSRVDGRKTSIKGICINNVYQILKFDESKCISTNGKEKGCTKEAAAQIISMNVDMKMNINAKKSYPLSEVDGYKEYKLEDLKKKYTIEPSQ